MWGHYAGRNISIQLYKRKLSREDTPLNREHKFLAASNSEYMWCSLSTKDTSLIRADYLPEGVLLLEGTPMYQVFMACADCMHKHLTALLTLDWVVNVNRFLPWKTFTFGSPCFQFVPHKWICIKIPLVVLTRYSWCLGTKPFCQEGPWGPNRRLMGHVKAMGWVTSPPSLAFPVYQNSL